MGSTPSLPMLLAVLRIAGFCVVGEDGAHVAVRRGARSFLVPKDPERLDACWTAVLACAGMDEETFIALAADAEALMSQLPSSLRVRVAATSARADE